MSLLDELLAGKNPQDLIARYPRPDFDSPTYRYRLSQAEAVAARGPQAFDLEPGHPSNLRILEQRYPVGSTPKPGDGEQLYPVGRFSTPTLAELKQGLMPEQFIATSEPLLRLSILLGISPLSDIQTLEAHADGDTVFQLASQFNGLEAPGPNLVPVAAYFDDRTQGPLGVLPVFAGALLRHYAAPSPKGPFIQTHDHQIELLADVLPPTIGKVQNGYLLSQNIQAPQALAEKLTTDFDKIRIGLHRDLVVTGTNVKLDQVLTSTLAGGGYSRSNTLIEPWLTIQRQLLRAAYLGTLLSAAEAGRSKVVLTAIGGGVFANPHPLIWESILWALDQARPYLKTPLHVVLNLRSFDIPPDQLATEAHKRQGKLIRF